MQAINENKKLLIIIPALEPSGNLLNLLDSLSRELQAQGDLPITAKILIVDDGSGPEYRDIFEKAKSQYGCILLRHAVNLGKGYALKTAFNFFLNEFPDFHSVVTVDSDGQHSAKDIIRCISGLSDDNSLILGCRDFSQKGIPLKSRFGNKLTRGIYNFLCGVKVSDTQTGLRVIPTGLLKTMLMVRGERFEYEMNVLIECASKGIEVKEVPIETIYLEGNSGTHFHPLFDSLKVYTTFLKFIGSSLGASCIDFIIFYIATTLHTGIGVSMILARIGSAAFNFTVNRNIVFKSSGNVWISVAKYLTLVAISGTISYGMITFMHGSMNLYISKIIAEVLLFFLNYFIQRTKIFNK